MVTVRSIGWLRLYILTQAHAFVCANRYLRSNESGVKSSAEHSSIVGMIQLAYHSQSADEFTACAEKLRQWCKKHRHDKVCAYGRAAHVALSVLLYLVA
jgi:delta 1-pyrroline-5-carboxylate dehydrogenase